MNFDQFSLDPRIEAGIKAAGYTIPTPIQKKAMHLVLDGRDVLGIAQTGTGKTAAFILPILQHLIDGRRGRVRALVVAPTRELAEQIYQASVDLGKKTDIRSVAIYGGVSKNKQIETLRRGVEIVIACPGRLLDIIGDRAINLTGVEVLVLDEADRMCDMGFLPDIRRLLTHLPEKRQTLFFSATMPKEIRKLADGILTDPATVQIGIIAPAKTVSHAIYPVKKDLKKDLLFDILDRTGTSRVLIFTRTKHRARSLALAMQKRGHRVSALQGNMSQNRRQEAITGFRSGKYDFLVATDIAARGIDISEISHVINFDMPDTVDAYTHRIGRTGRALQSGEAFTFATSEDTPILKQIERSLGDTIERRQLSGFDYSRQVAAPTQAEGGGRSTNKSSPRRGTSSHGNRRPPRQRRT